MLGMICCATGIQKPGFGTRRINLQQLEQLLFESPAINQHLFRDVQRPQHNAARKKVR